MVHVVTASVKLTVEINGHETVLDILRLSRAPHWMLDVRDKAGEEITLTRNDDIEPEYAAFHLTITKTVNGGR